MVRKASSPVVALLALDDTDTLEGGCTTHAAYQIACAVQEAAGALASWGLVAPPRLVRLCPAIRDKTRGNGALVLPIGPRDTEAAGIPIGATPGGDPLVIGAAAPPRNAPDPAVTAALQAVVDAHLPGAGPEQADPQPAALLLREPAEHPLYRQAVVRRVSAAEAWSMAPASTERLTPTGRRGEVGALAATAWRPEPEAMTWEAIGYRSGRSKERDLPDDLRMRLQALPGGFDNVDEATGRIRAVPRTPCPVRFGVRGLDPGALRRFAAEPTMTGDGIGWWLVATNHARGDTLRLAMTERAPERIVRVMATVQAAPQRGRGGHVFVDVRDDQGEAFRVAAFEPTKGLAGIVAHLRAGDRMEAFGRTGSRADVVALEAFRVVHLAPRIVKDANPRCACGAAMKSRGRDAGFRCRHCRKKASPAARGGRIVPDPALAVGAWHQVPDHVRGHLLPPLRILPAALPLAPSTAPPKPPLVRQG